ncbi:uncharacterized protein LOC119075726 [Bradysia coprophila]|uniref:uncharacterized protein LOC119075726 n=1 Tax=Bradysia coprophila TaxID=38358 RepID=UPI00187D8216|nr:uncharacterized protein LOC119075726 [Bradysia coprophila]XP_037038163.1 uncharacterized protein LOC119075726 [Bradysia coprophila]
MASSPTTTTVLEQKTNSLKLTLDHPIPSGDTAAEITFFKDPEDGSTPFYYVYSPPEGQPQTNIGSETLKVTIQDIRGKESTFSVDSSGFVALENIPSKLVYEDWENDDIIKKNYYPEIEKLLLDNLIGANRVFIFDHTIRRTTPLPNTSPADVRQPVMRAHIDQTGQATLNRVRYHLPEEADELLKGRVRIVNVWRPLKGPIRAFPLAMADSRTVGFNDLTAVEHRYPDRTGWTVGVRHRPAQKWWYWSGMKEHERILLQCFDSHGSQARVAHTAFEHPESLPEDGRESIEVRALIFG